MVAAVHKVKEQWYIFRVVCSKRPGRQVKVRGYDGRVRIVGRKEDGRPQ